MPDPDRIAGLTSLEHALWQAKTRFDRKFMERTLATDFVEFGRSGRVWSRAETIAMTGGTIEASLRNLEVHALADDVALVTYLSEVQHEVLDLAHRSSVWVHRDGRWQLRFHQGTAVS